MKRGRRRARSRRSAGRGREVAHSVAAIAVLLAAAVVIVAASIFLVKKLQGGRVGDIPVESGRMVAPESFPEADGTSPGEPETIAEEDREDSGEAQEALLTPEERARQTAAGMSLEEKVGQMFVITPEALTGVDLVYAAGGATKAAYERYPVGGLVYFKNNLQNPQQVRAMLSNTKSYSLDRVGVPVFLSVDEEGGTVARVGSQESFGVPKIDDMARIGASGDPQLAYETGATIGGYLADLGFNMDYAPVADVLTNPENTVVAKRSFGTDAGEVSKFVLMEVRGLEEQGVIPVLKHFPGHGGTKGDTHKGYAYTEKTLDELMKNELLPFGEGISAGVDVIMAAHIAAPGVTGDNTPSSLSEEMITGVLREEMGFEGIVITDAMDMGAVSQEYSPGEAAVAAVRAGVDMILMPEDFYAAYDALIDAVNSGEISEQRIDESVLRILEVKFEKIF